MTRMVDVRLTVNGKTYEGRCEPRTLLADFLRDDLSLTGTHVGCEHGACGACTILYNGEAARSCIMFAVQAHGADIVTVEGIAKGSVLHPLQSAFHEHHGLQCGFCTPGMLITALDFLRVNPSPSVSEVRAGTVRGAVPLHRLPEHRHGGDGGRRDDAARTGLERDRLDGTRCRSRTDMSDARCRGARTAACWWAAASSWPI